MKRTTEKTYDSRWKAWQQHCRSEGISAAAPTEADVVNFLAQQYSNGADYAKLNALRSALASAIPGVSDMDDMKRVLAAAMRHRPPNTRQGDDVWDPQLIVDLWKKRRSNAQLDTPALREKTVSLLALASHSRMSDIAAISASAVSCEQARMRYKQWPGKVRHQGDGRLVRRDPIDAYAEDPHICPVRAVEAYMQRTEQHRSAEHDRLFLALRKTKRNGAQFYGALVTDSVARIMFKVMKEAGVNTEEYKAGSSRSASSSAALEAGAAVDAVMRRGNWASRRVFNEFYNRAQGPEGVTTRVFAPTRSRTHNGSV